MKNLIKMHATSLLLTSLMFLFVGNQKGVEVLANSAPQVQITTNLPVITLSTILTFAVRVFFTIAGIAALFYMLIGAFTWVTSGGDEESVTKARNKIQAAVVGMILIVGVLAIIWTLEQIIFSEQICLGLSCPLTIPSLIDRPTITPTPT